MEQQGQGFSARTRPGRYDRNALVGDSPGETIARCHESVEYLTHSAEDLHPGLQHQLRQLWDALGYERHERRRGQHRG